MVFTFACGGETDFSGRCRGEGDRLTVLNGVSQIEMARDLGTVDGDLMICNFDSDVSLPNLRGVGGSLIVQAYTQATVFFPKLIQTGGEIRASAVDMILPQLEESKAIVFTGQSRTQLSLPSLTRVRHLQWSGSVDAPVLVACDSIATGPLVAPKLRRFNSGTISPYGQSQLPSLDNFISAAFDLTATSSTVTLPALREAKTISFVASDGQRTAERIWMPLLQTADDLSFESQTELTAIDFPSLTSLKSVTAINNPKLPHCDLKALADRTNAALTSVGSFNAAPCD